MTSCAPWPFSRPAAEVRVYRVTVRGKFGSLDDATHAYLTREQPEHDIFKLDFK